MELVNRNDARTSQINIWRILINKSDLPHWFVLVKRFPKLNQKIGGFLFCVFFLFGDFFSIQANTFSLFAKACFPGKEILRWILKNPKCVTKLCEIINHTQSLSVQSLNFLLIFPRMPEFGGLGEDALSHWFLPWTFILNAPTADTWCAQPLLSKSL